MESAFDSKAQVLRIYVPERRHKDDQPVYEWIVCRACEQGIAGATILRGSGGYYMNDPVKSPDIIDLKIMCPVVIEIVDQPERIEKFAAFLKHEIAQILMCRFSADICFSGED